MTSLIAMYYPPRVPGAVKSPPPRRIAKARTAGAIYRQLYSGNRDIMNEQESNVRIYQQR